MIFEVEYNNISSLFSSSPIFTTDLALLETMVSQHAREPLLVPPSVLEPRLDKS
jgi:hypothetical protein